MNLVGIVQGRLTPSYNGKLQCFPKDNWRDEFRLAKICGFEAIELLYEKENDPSNPLLTAQGICALRNESDISRISISSILVDYSMLFMLLTVGSGYYETLQRFEFLVRQANQLNVEKLILPFFELDDMDWALQRTKFRRELGLCARFAERFNVRIVLEATIPSDKIVQILEFLGGFDVSICYDLGNATANGYDLKTDIQLLGERISHVHVKDRLKHGGANVPLGTGDADFKSAFSALNGIAYKGPLICETARGEVPLETGQMHSQFVRRLLWDFATNK